MSAVFLRHPENPVLTVKDLPEGVGYFLLNPGAVKFNGEYLLIVDVFHVEGGIVFWIARSKDGIHFTFDPSPLQMPPCAKLVLQSARPRLVASTTFPCGAR